jgi:hypothetical protein
MLGNLHAILSKAQAHAQARGVDELVLTSARLYPDMLPLGNQVMIATDTAKGCAARLAGVTPPVYEDTEKTFAELNERIAKTLVYLQSFKPEQIDGSEGREVVLKRRTGEERHQGLPYLQNIAQPNFFFHVTTAYAILRHNGVEIGKRDFLGA